MTTPLEDLDLTDIGVAVRSFRNLFYHRTVILEGIRQIVGRNMVHLADAAERYDAGISPEENERTTRAIILSDQGLENNAANRFISGIATHCPFQVYLALLYAELDCVREWQDQSRVLANDGLRQYLEENEEEIDMLRKCRDSFLHSTPTSAHLQVEFLDLTSTVQKRATDCSAVT